MPSLIQNQCSSRPNDMTFLQHYSSLPMQTIVFLLRRPSSTESLTSCSPNDTLILFQRQDSSKSQSRPTQMQSPMIHTAQVSRPVNKNFHQSKESLPQRDRKMCNLFIYANFKLTLTNLKRSKQPPCERGSPCC